MDCRSFRNKHLAYLDDTLPAVEMAVMRRHAAECEACARHDTRIRRSLLVMRNLPEIRPSAEFSTRLRARLAAERARPPAPVFRGPGLRAFLAAAASIVGIGLMTLEAFSRFEAPVAEMRVAVVDPAAASTPSVSAVDDGSGMMRDAAGDAVSADPMLMASASAGVPIWPALMLAQEAPMQFARVQFRRASGDE